MLGKIFKYILVILLGMILGAGAVVGAGYLLVTKTKVGTITEKVPSLNEYLGESLNDYTLIEAVQKLSAPDTTIGQYTEYLPFLDGLLKNLAEDESIKQYVTIDIDKLKTFTFSQVGANFMSAVSVTASLNSISDTLGFTLPDLPLFTTKENYVKITDENFAVGNLYYKDKTENIYYIAEEGGYANAYAEGVLVDAAKGKDLYFKSAGLMEIPVTDAVGSLSSTLSDIDSMTIDDLNDDFGIDLIGSDPLVAKIVHGDDTLNSIADNMMSRVDGLTLEGDLAPDELPLFGENRSERPADLERRIDLLRRPDAAGKLHRPRRTVDTHGIDAYDRQPHRTLRPARTAATTGEQADHPHELISSFHTSLNLMQMYRSAHPSKRMIWMQHCPIRTIFVKISKKSVDMNRIIRYFARN